MIKRMALRLNELIWTKLVFPMYKNKRIPKSFTDSVYDFLIEPLRKIHKQF